MGKGSGQVEVTEYTMTMHYGISVEVDALRRIVIKEKEAWTGTVTGLNSFAVSAPDLFGGIKKEGGVGGVVTFLPGAADQVLPDWLAQKMGRANGADCPGYRGIASLFFTGADQAPGGGVIGGVFTEKLGLRRMNAGFYWTANNPYLPGVWVTVQRAPVGLTPGLAMIEAPTLAMSGATAWRYLPISLGDSTDRSAVDFDDSGWQIGTSPFGNNHEADPPSVTYLAESTAAWLRCHVSDDVTSLTFSCDDDADIYYNGAYLGSYGIGSHTVALTPGGNNDNLLAVRISDDAGYNFYWNDDLPHASAALAGPNANPAHIIYECLTNTDWGMGSPSTGIDVDSFEDAAQTLYNEAFGLSMLWTRQAKIEDFVQEVLDHIQGVIFVDPRTGLLTLKLIRGDYASTSFDEDFSDGLADFVTHTGSSASLTIVSDTYGDCLQVAPGANVIDAIVQDIGNEAFTRVSVKFKVTATGNDDYGVIDLRDGNDDIVFTLTPGRDLLIDALRRPNVSFADQPGQPGNPIGAGAVTTNRWYQFEAVYDSSADTFDVTITDLTDMSVFGTATIPVSTRSPISKLIFRTENAHGSGTVRWDDFAIDFESELPEINPDNADLTSFGRKLWGDIVNEIVVTWTNPENEQDETITCQDLASIATQGGIVSDSRNYYGVRNAELAQMLGWRDLRSAGQPLASCVAEVDRTFWDLRPASVVRVTWPEYGLEEIVMRVTSIDYGRPGDPTIKLDLVEDVYGLDIGDYESPPSSEWVDDRSRAEPVETVEIVTLPYYLAVRSPAAEFVDSPEYPEVVAGVMATTEASDTFELELWDEVTLGNGSTEWQRLAAINIFGRGELGGALALEATSTAVTFDNRIGQTIPVVAGFVVIGEEGDDGNEIAMIDAADYDTGEFTLIRGVLDTVPRAWPAATVVRFVDSSTLFEDSVVRSSGEVVDYKILSRTSVNLLPLESADLESATLSDRPWLPNRPADVEAYGEAWSSAVVPINAIARPDPWVTVTWANRNRLLEDSQVLAWTDGDVTPETGQTTRIEVVAPDDTPLATHDGLTGTSFDVPNSSFGIEPIVRLQVYADRSDADSDFASLQFFEHWVQVQATGGDRVTEEGDARVTEEGNTRVTET